LIMMGDQQTKGSKSAGKMLPGFIFSYYQMAK
jgi:hypothetical protein